MLDTKELKRRLDALRTLRNLSQDQLAALLHEDDDWGKHDLGRMERGDARIRPTDGRMRAIAHHLRIDPRWLLEDDLDEILAVARRDEVLARIADNRSRLEEIIDTLRGEIAELGRQVAEIRAVAIERVGEDVRGAGTTEEPSATGEEAARTDRRR